MTYLIAKWLHILSSTVLFGTGLGSAYYMFFASRSGDARTAATVVRYVVIADWLFTTTTIILQPLTGLWLAHLAQIPLTSRWILFLRPLLRRRRLLDPGGRDPDPDAPAGRVGSHARRAVAP